MHRQSRWNSDFAKALLERTESQTVEDAVATVVGQKLAVLGSLKPPIDLPLLASICGIMPNIQAVDMKQDGRLIYKDSQYYIQVNKHHPIGKQRFATAHEIDHKILAMKLKDIVARDCDGIGYALRKLEEEWLCDLGARHLLLLTSEFLQPIIDDMGFNLKTINEIAKLFQVSFEAAARCLVEVFEPPVAVIYYVWGYRKEELIRSHMQPLFHNEVDPILPKLRIERAYKSKSFPTVLPKNKSIPNESCVVQAFYEDDVLVCRENVSFDSKMTFTFDIEASKQMVYTKGIPNTGVVVLLSYPAQLL